MGKLKSQHRQIPERTCVACRTTRPKRALVRIVSLAEGGDVIVDETGKRNGRGAYLCRQRTCWEQALRRHILDHALRVTLSPEATATLLAYAQTLPATLEPTSAESPTGEELL